jgi:hypothetical protein
MYLCLSARLAVGRSRVMSQGAPLAVLKIHLNLNEPTHEDAAAPIGLLAQGPLLAVLSSSRGGPSPLRKSNVGHEVRLVRKGLRKAGVCRLDRAASEISFMTSEKREHITANAKFEELEMGYASFDEQGRGIRIAAFTEKPDLHVSFALSCEEALKLAAQIKERAETRMSIRDRVSSEKTGE